MFPFFKHHFRHFELRLPAPTYPWATGALRSLGAMGALAQSPSRLQWRSMWVISFFHIFPQFHWSFRVFSVFFNGEHRSRQVFVATLNGQTTAWRGVTQCVQRIHSDRTSPIFNNIPVIHTKLGFSVSFIRISPFKSTEDDEFPHDFGAGSWWIRVLQRLMTDRS